MLLSFVAYLMILPRTIYYGVIIHKTKVYFFIGGVGLSP
jgi:hypothetical protein